MLPVYTILSSAAVFVYILSRPLLMPAGLLVGIPGRIFFLWNPSAIPVPWGASRFLFPVRKHRSALF